MGTRNADFTEVVHQLGPVREELVGTSRPETVAVLRELAEDLVARAGSCSGNTGRTRRPGTGGRLSKRGSSGGSSDGRNDRRNRYRHSRA